MQKKCMVCDSEESIQFGDYRWIFWDVAYSLLKCVACGSVFTTPMPDDDTLSKVYSGGFDYRWYEDHFKGKFIDAEIRIREYVKLLGKKVLDFGGGLGYFSKAAEMAGYISKTYDPFKNKNDKVEGKWDTVVALHVLEHSNNLDKTISEMKFLLEPHGNLILTVPNLLCKGYKELGMEWVWAQPPLLHIFHFTDNGLKRLLLRHGFSEIEITYHERWDANLYTDLKRVRMFRYLDSIWHKKFINRYSIMRKLSASINSILRYWGLRRALVGYNSANNEYAELQINARLH